ncbi:LysE/ArgO family amino acid transporter [Rathayibacter sp. YIM 133350]|uniref:LysE/ArgO family amino acid transporter n=1 Tax=Rathayibacter sp. YIM 133350 TaxID=3131992 RepID=UPI00307ED4CA
MLPTLLAGLGLGLSLIIAIGGQNLFVLRQGIRREHVLAVVVICALSDAVLIAVGISGIGAALQHLPWLLSAVRWVGAAFLVFYGLLAARRALRPTAQSAALTDDDTLGPREGDDGVAGAGVDTFPAGAAAPEAAESDAARQPGPVLTRTTPAARSSLITVMLTCLALTWLNPHVYLDTVFLLGSVANTHGDDRWVFGLGAAIGSVAWFTALGFGARHLGRWLRSPRSWRILDAAIAVVMVALGVMLVVQG